MSCDAALAEQPGLVGLGHIPNFPSFWDFREYNVIIWQGCYLVTVQFCNSGFVSFPVAVGFRCLKCVAHFVAFDIGTVVTLHIFLHLEQLLLFILLSFSKCNVLFRCIRCLSLHE